MKIYFDLNDKLRIYRLVEKALDKMSGRTIYPGDTITLDLSGIVDMKLSFGVFKEMNDADKKYSASGDVIDLGGV